MIQTWLWITWKMCMLLRLMRITNNLFLFFKHISWLNDLENVGISLVFTHFFSSLYQFDNFSHIYITFLCITCINSSIKFQLIIIYIDCLCLCRRWKRKVKICANVSSRLDDKFWGYKLLDFSTPFAQNTAAQFLKRVSFFQELKNYWNKFCEFRRVCRHHISFRFLRVADKNLSISSPLFWLDCGVWLVHKISSLSVFLRARRSSDLKKGSRGRRVLNIYS